MNTNPDQQPEVDVAKLAIEYGALRAEVLKRIELRQQFASITLAIAGIFLSIGVTTDTVVLVYPLLVVFLATGWAHNDWRISEASIYIRECIETKTPYLHWETFVRQTRDVTRTHGWRQLLLSYGGIFILTQLAAIAIGVFRFESTAAEWILLFFDLVAVAWVVSVVVRAERRPVKSGGAGLGCGSPPLVPDQQK